MISPFACGPLCQHPGCWKAKVAPQNLNNTRQLDDHEDQNSSEFSLPTLSVSLLEPQKIQRHRSLPPIKNSPINSGLPAKPQSSFHCFRRKEVEVPRVSHIIVQAGFQCHPQKRWIWLPSLQNQDEQSTKIDIAFPPTIKDLTNDLIQSRPASSKAARSLQTRVMHSRPKGSSYLDLVRKLGYLNLLDLPHYLQVKLLENTQFRKILSSHPIDHLPYNSLPETVLLDLIRCQLSPQLPTNPSLEGVGIFFDPPDDLASKQEPKPVIMPARRGGPEPNTYVPGTRPVEPSDLPGPQIKPAGMPTFREYVMLKRASTDPSVIDVPQGAISGSSNKSSESDLDRTNHNSHVSSTSISCSVKTMSEKRELVEEQGEEYQDDSKITQSLEIILPADESVEGIRIPSAIEEEDLELAGIRDSVPPTRDSWRQPTSFSTVTPLSDHPNSATEKLHAVTPLTPHIETKTISADVSMGSLVDEQVERALVDERIEGCDSKRNLSSPGILPPACTPTEDPPMDILALQP